MEKKEELRIQILNTATNQFRLHGIKAVKMDDLSALLKISKRTLYEIYDNKRDLLFDVLQNGSLQRRERLRQFALTCDNVMDCLIEFFRIQTDAYLSTNPLFFKELEKYPDIIEEIRLRSDDLYQKSESFFKKGVEEGYFINGVDYMLLIRLSSESLEYIRRSGNFQDSTPLDIFFSYVCVIIRGFCTNKGIERLEEFLQKLKS